MKTEDKKGWKMINKSNLKFKNIIEDLLVEFPQRIERVEFDELNDDRENRNMRNVFVKTGKYIGVFNERLKIYSIKSGKFTIDVFCDDVRILAFFSYEIQNKTMFESRVWQDMICSGLCRNIVFDYYLKKFNKIISDEQHTKEGENYWKKLVDKALIENYKVYIQFENEIETINSTKDLEYYYDKVPDFQKLKIVVEK